MRPEVLSRAFKRPQGGRSSAAAAAVAIASTATLSIASRTKETVNTMMGSGYERRTEPEPPAGPRLRVYELAKDLNVQAKDLVAKIRALGIEVENHMSYLEPTTSTACAAPSSASAWRTSKRSGSTTPSSAAARRAPSRVRRSRRLSPPRPPRPHRLSRPAPQPPRAPARRPRSRACCAGRSEGRARRRAAREGAGCGAAGRQRAAARGSPGCACRGRARRSRAYDSARRATPTTAAPTPPPPPTRSGRDGELPLVSARRSSTIPQPVVTGSAATGASFSSRARRRGARPRRRASRSRTATRSCAVSDRAPLLTRAPAGAATSFGRPGLWARRSAPGRHPQEARRRRRQEAQADPDHHARRAQARHPHGGHDRRGRARASRWASRRPRCSRSSGRWA